MSKILSRRTVLRGLGATVALPFLDAMRPRSARAAAAAGVGPTRLGFLFMPNGVREDRWTPEGTGADFKFSPILSPLESLRQDITVMTGLGNRASLTGDGHYAKTANWLTGTPIAKTTGKDLHCGVSVDQVLAKERGHLTRFPSLELGTDPIMSGVDRNVNYTMLYGSHIAWRTPTSPIPAEINPRFVFDRLFREDATQRKASAEENKSVLDLVLAEAKTLRASVGQEDQQRLDEYLESLRHIERRIEADIARVATGENLDPAAKEALGRLDQRITDVMGQGAAHPGSQLRLDHSEHCRLMLDLMALSFQTDTTRASTFMFGWAVSGKNFSFLPGVNGGHHEISHHDNKAEKLDAYEKINRWHVEQYAYLIGKLKSIREGDGNLLDNSLILFGSSIRDGNKHDPRNLPLVLAGHGGGVKGGQHLVAEKDTPLCNLYASLLNRAGVETNAFGDSTGWLGV